MIFDSNRQIAPKRNRSYAAKRFDWFEPKRALLGPESYSGNRSNCAGGKPESGESIEQAAVRECQEEINITPLNLDKVAVIDFFLKSIQQPQRVTVFLCGHWKGEPSETEEMAPKWFNVDEIPYKDMWPDDRYWLMGVINGEKIKADFYLGEHDRVIKYNISPMI